MFEAREIITQNNHWISVVFFTILVLLTLSKVLYQDRLFHTTTYFLYQKYLPIYFGKEKRNTFNLFQFILFIVQVLTLSLLTYFFFKINYLHPTVNTFFYISAGIFTYFFCKYLLRLFLGFVFEIQHLLDKISFEKMSYFNNLVLWILPLLFISFYTPYNPAFTFKITFVFFLVLLVIRYVLVILNNKNLVFNNLFYFILYLCALEIAPLIILLKITI